MREIKFRGKNSAGWVIGSLIVNPVYTAIIEIEDPDEGTSVRHYVIPDTVGQYTGLKDATGKEIYEGDIIKTRKGDVGVIVWETELGSFRARLADNSFYTLTAFFASMFSVIGNIHDNPELLEAQA